MHMDVTPPQLRSFGLGVGSMLAVIGLWPAVWRSGEIRLWALVLAGMFSVLALIRPRSLRLLHSVWTMVGNSLGWLHTRLIFGAVFYGLLTPMGLVLRCMGKDAMRRTWAPHADTYRLICQPRPKSHMTRQF
jgi:uncharacterized membrane protein